MLIKFFQISEKRIHVNCFIGTQNRPVVDGWILGPVNDPGNVIEKRTHEKIKNNFLDKIRVEESDSPAHEKSREPIGRAACL